MKNEFICIRFNQLPQKDIRRFIEQLVVGEKLDITGETIEKIQQMYQSDIRSMINFIQLHQNYDCMQSNIITSNTWVQMNKIIEGTVAVDIHEYIQQMSIQYNTDKKTIIKEYYNYVVRNHPEKINMAYLTNIEAILHTTETNCMNVINYMKHM